ncbi:MAG: (2Fe-2S)-binding protein [Halioglobus sp.]|nr:(2Fe-2S)-binding protein [Halioglobus sp.]
MIEVIVNKQVVRMDVPPEMPLLWALRDHLELTGTKFGCGIAQCGACTVHLDGRAIRACVTPVRSVAGKSITTIEGIADGENLSPLQQAWIAFQVPQCGYCQSGQIMSATALLAENPNPSDEEIRTAMAGSICRCGMYNRIHKAIRAVADGEVAIWDPAEQGNVREVQHG